MSFVNSSKLWLLVRIYFVQEMSALVSSFRTQNHFLIPWSNIRFSRPSGKRSKTRAREGLETGLSLRSVERLVKLFDVVQCHRKSDMGIL